MNAVLYARVSTEKQAEKELSIPAQLTAMREYARKNQWTISDEFIEPGASARTTERPMLKRMLARCKELPKVNVVLVHKVDRLARDLYGHATIKTMLKQHGIRLASVVENVDDSITGQLVENIMASLAEFYSSNLGEEVKKGMRVMVQRGEWPHQPPRGYRMTRTAENRPLAVPFEPESTVIAEAFRLYATGRFSLRDIGQELLIRGVATDKGRSVSLSYVQGMLENPFYCGRIRWNGSDYAGKHEPIVPEQLYLKVQAVLRHRFKTPGERGRTKYLMRGLATCAECGHMMTAERHKLWTYYRCVEHAHGRCRSQMSNTASVHSELLKLYRRIHLPAEWKATVLEKAAAESERRDRRRRKNSGALQRRHDRLVGQELKLTESFTAGDTSPNAYKATSLRLRRQIATAEELLRDTGHSGAAVLPRIERLLGSTNAIADLHQQFDVSRQQRLLSVVFKRLAMEGGSITDFALNAPFDSFFVKPTDASKTPSGGSAPPFEPAPPERAIKSLFEFDYDAFERLLSADGGDESNTQRSRDLDKAPLH